MHPYPCSFSTSSFPHSARDAFVCSEEQVEGCTGLHTFPSAPTDRGRHVLLLVALSNRPAAPAPGVDEWTPLSTPGSGPGQATVGSAPHSASDSLNPARLSRSRALCDTLAGGLPEPLSGLLSAVSTPSPGAARAGARTPPAGRLAGWQAPHAGSRADGFGLLTRPPDEWAIRPPRAGAR